MSCAPIRADQRHATGCLLIDTVGRIPTVQRNPMVGMKLQGLTKTAMVAPNLRVRLASGKYMHTSMCTILGRAAAAAACRHSLGRIHITMFIVQSHSGVSAATPQAVPTPACLSAEYVTAKCQSVGGRLDVRPATWYRQALRPHTPECTAGSSVARCCR
jgi:hypothetical protein